MAGERLQLILELVTGQYKREARDSARATRDIAAAAEEAEASSRDLDSSFKNVSGKIGRSEDEARALASSVSKSVRESRELDDELRAVARGLGLSEREAAEFAREMRRAKDNTDDVDQSVGRLNQGFAKMKGLIAGAIAVGAIAAAVRVGLRGAGEAIASYNTLNESVNAVNVAFGEGADIVFDYGEQVHRTAGLARGDFQQLVVPIGSLLRNFGFEATAAANAAVVLTQRAADLASVFDTDVSEALGAIQAALRGEGDPIERFGASISAARVEAKALELGLAASKAEIDDTAKVTARYQLILEDTARVAGDFARTADDPANFARIQAAAAENARAALGEELIPAYLEILQLAPDLIEALEGVGPALGLLASSVSASADEIGGVIIGTLHLLARLPVAVEIFSLQLEDLFARWSEVGTEGNADRTFRRRVQDVEQAGDAAERAAAHTEALAGLYARLDLITAIQGGVDPLFALGGAISALTSEGVSLRGEFGQLAATAGLSGGALGDAIQTFLNNSAHLRLAADDVAFLRFELEVLKDEIAFSGDVGFIENIEDISKRGRRALEDTIVTFADLLAAAEETGQSITEIFGSDLFEGQPFDSLARIEVELAGFRDRVNEIGRQIDPMKGAVEQLDISMDEFLSNFLGSFEQQVEFEANLTRLTDAGFGAMADRIEAVGPGLNDLVLELLDNLDQVAAAETSAQNTATAYENALRQQFIAAGFDALGQEVSLKLFGGIGEFINRNAGRLSEDQIKNLAAGVTSPASLTFASDAGVEIGESIDDGIADFIREHADEIGFDAVRDLAAGVTSIDSLEEMMRAGRSIADIFSQAFAENVRFDFDLPTPTVRSGTSASGSTAIPRAHGGPVMADFHYRVGEGDRPELLMIPGDRGTVFSNTDVQRMIAAFTGGGGPAGPVAVHVYNPASTVDVARGVQEGLLLAGISRTVEVAG